MTRRRTACLAAYEALLLGALSPAWPVTVAAPFTPSPPLHVGVGGDYPDGLDGVLAENGLPHERIFTWELSDPEALKRYEVLLLSCPVATRGGMDRALTEWMKAGGRLYVEVWAGLQGPYPLQQLVSIVTSAPEYSDVLLTDPSHPIVAGLDPKATIDMFHLQGTVIRLQRPGEGQVVAQFCYDGTSNPVASGAAVVSLPVGKGELVYSGAALSFCRFHRGPGPDALLMGITRELSQGRGAPRLSVNVMGQAPDKANGSAGESPRAPHTARRAGQSRTAGPAPVGYEVVDVAEDQAYNVSLRVGPAGQGGPSRLVMDGEFDATGRARRPCLWLTVGTNALELRQGKADGGAPLASAAWQPPARATELLVERRPGAISVVVGDTEVLQARTRIAAGGVVAASQGAVPLGDACCQPVGEPVFNDDFMRDSGEPLGWTPVSGQWFNVGVGHEGYSVNGFYLRGQSAEMGIAATGESYWEEYAFSAAARLDQPGGAGGLCVLRQTNGDCVGFVADSAGGPSAKLAIVRVRAGQESTLAERPGGLESGQWYRLAVRLLGGRVEALVDGDKVLECANPEPRGGGIGLLVRRGVARFDDVLVQPADQPLRVPRDEGSPAPALPPSLGPQDSLTWASPASAWAACPERPSLLWHQGDFGNEVEVSLPVGPITESALRRVVLAPSPSAPESEWLSIAADLRPGTKQANLAITEPGRKPLTTAVTLGPAGELRVVRQGNAATVWWCGRSVWRTTGAGGLRRVGLEVYGPPVPAESLQVRSPQVRDYVFGAAPTDWWVSSGTWEVAARWSCDNRWSWFAGWDAGDAVIWNKVPVQGDVAVDCYMGIKMEAPGGPETYRCRDLNVVLCGDKTNPRSGYSFILGGDGGVKTQLLRNGAVVAECPDIRVPPGYGIHHQWHHVQVARIGHSIRLDLNGRPAFRYEDPDPLPGGYVGLWTRNSGVLVPRVTVYQ